MKKPSSEAGPYQRRREQAATEEANANANPVNNLPAQAAAASPGQAVANSGQAVAVLEIAQDEAAMTEGSVRHPVVSIDARACM